MNLKKATYTAVIITAATLAGLAAAHPSGQAIQTTMALPFLLAATALVIVVGIVHTVANQHRQGRDDHNL